MVKRHVHVPTPRTLEEGWRNIEAVLQAARPDRPVPSMFRDMYFAGAATLMALVTEAPEMAEDVDDEVGVALMERLEQEIKIYAGELMAPQVYAAVPSRVM